MPLSIIIVDKTGSIKELAVKEYNESELYKKCGFKKSEDFALQKELDLTLFGQKYTFAIYGKCNGKSGSENKYEYFSQIDSQVYYGSCAVVGYVRDDTNNKELINLSEQLWENAVLYGLEDDSYEFSSSKIPIVKEINDNISDDDVSETDEQQSLNQEDEDEDEEEDNELCSELSEEKYDYSDTE